MSGLTTHILDTAAGRPAAGVKVKLFRLHDEHDSQFVRDIVTNSDGRGDTALLDAGDMAIGTYELRFYIGDYFAARRVELADPAFLDIVPIRFAIADPAAHYHIPLLVTPWSYSTYRGS